MRYTFEDLVAAYKGLGVAPGKVVYVTSEMARLGPYAGGRRQEILKAHYDALRSILGDSGTIVVPTASTNLANTDTVFDLQETPSFERGVFSEFVRQQKGAIRSFHPFISYTAIGAKAQDITQNVSRQAFGPETPEMRMVERGALAVSLGLHPRYTCSTVHCAEQMTGVPYRYTKEFLHPVIRGDKIQQELFYMFVIYRDLDLVRDGNEELFNRIEKRIDLKSRKVGRGKIYSYSMRKFLDETIKTMAEDNYVFCKSLSDARPYHD